LNNPSPDLADEDVEKEFPPLHKCTLILVNKVGRHFFESMADEFGYAFVEDYAA